MPSTKSLTMLWLIIILTIYSLSSLALAQNDTSNTSDNILALISENNCPPPLIVRDPNGLIDPSQNCLNNCCLACPFPNNFYEKKKIETTYKVFAVIGIISFFLMILLCVFFMIFPSQKQNHLAKLLLFPLALSVMIFEGSEFFTLNQRQSQCLDPITAAIPKKNRYCTAQAFFTLSGAYATASYSALLMVHLHLISVWRSEFVTKRIKIFHALIFGSSLAAFLFPYFSNNIQSSSNICFISLDAAPSYFFFLSFIYIAFAAHLTTFIHMVHVTLKSNRHYSVMSSLSKLEAERQLIYLITIFKMQWRALLGALLMLVIYVLNWYFYVFKLRSSNSAILTNSWVIDWLTCLYNKRDQNSCVAIADVPSYGYIVTLLFFNRTAGILIFIIFAAKKSILLEAYDFIRGKSRSTSVSFFETESGFRSTRGSIRRYSTAENGIITSSEGIKAGNSIGRNRSDIRSDPISIKFSQKEKILT